MKQTITLASLALLLTACGGSGNGNNPPPPASSSSSSVESSSSVAVSSSSSSSVEVSSSSSSVSSSSSSSSSSSEASSSSSSSSESSSSSSASSEASFGDALNGAALFADNCSLCHSPNDDGTFGQAGRNSHINPNSINHIGGNYPATVEGLAAYIAAEMPPAPIANPADCIDECARDTAAFIWSFRDEGESTSSSSLASSSSSSSEASSSSSSSSAMASNCENGAVFCENFENIGGGELPEGLSFRSCNGNGSSYDVTPNGALEGGSSISLTAGANYCEAWLNIDAMKDLTAGYVRFRVMEESAKGGNRWFMLVENGANADSNGNSLRMRVFDGNVLAWNVEAAGDTIAPDFYSPGQRESTVSLPTGEPTCFEVFFDDANDIIRIWMNDQLVSGLELDNDASTGFDQRFLGSYGGNFNVDVNLIRLGWQGSSAATMIYDDIVVSESKIGCN